MLKDFAKYLPFLQTPGKRTKPLDESAQAPAPDAPLPEQEETIYPCKPQGLASNHPPGRRAVFPPAGKALPPDPQMGRGFPPGRDPPKWTVSRP